MDRAYLVLGCSALLACSGDSAGADLFAAQLDPAATAGANVSGGGFGADGGLAPQGSNLPAASSGLGCGVSEQAMSQVAPTDVIWAIDTSGSMDAFFPTIQAALTDFSAQIESAGIDAHIVLLAGANFCVPAPLGSGNCGAGGGFGPPVGGTGTSPDSNEPKFRHLNISFGQNMGMGVILDNYDAYKDLLRPGAHTHIVMTEDGDSPVMAMGVTQHVQGEATAACDGGNIFLGGGLGCPSGAMWSPGLTPGRWTMHGVVCQGGGDFLSGVCASGGPPPNTMALVKQTGGLSSDLGDANGGGDPFAALLEKLAEQVIINAISCDYDIPASDEPFDKGKVNVFYTDSAGGAMQFGKAASGAGCGTSLGWHYDNEAADKPGKVLLCPAACDLVQKDANARVDVEFGCDTVPII